MAVHNHDAAIPMVPIPEEPSMSLRSLGQSAAASTGHITGFTGCLPVLDHCFFVISCCGFAGVLLFLTINGKFVWASSLVAIAAVATAAECAECVCKRQQQVRRSLWDRKVLRFVCGMPFAFFCFYATSITRQTGSCTWYIEVHEMPQLILAKGGVLLSGWVAVFSLALGTLNIDCRASSAVSHFVSNGRWYTMCHLLFRASEMMFRLGAAVFLCEGFRVLARGFNVSDFFLCAPFLCLVLLYAVFFRCAGHEAEGTHADTPFTCFIVAAFTLALNPMHFVALPGYKEQTLKINKGLFVIRVGELGLSICLVYFTIKLPVPEGLCDERMSGLDVLLLGPVVYQFVASLAVHYLVMALHGDIQHSTCQSLSGEGAGRARARVRVAFPRPERNDLYVPPHPSNAGLLRAWVQLAGGMPLSVASEVPPEVFDQIYEIRSVLGGGTFGVVVRVEKVGDQAQAMAMKLLNTSRPRDRLLAEREVAIYGKIWSQENALEEGLVAVGHPFIVRLHFWSIWDDERKFFLSNDTEDEVQHNRINKFSIALVMELCDDNLEGYLKKEFTGASQAWLATLVRILSMILLALEFLHRKNMAYRDLKLDNVLVSSTSSGEVLCKLADFGYGREVDPTTAGRPVSVAGSPYFCAPEMEDRVAGHVVQMNQEQENALDSYSYGTVVYALAKGPNFVTRRAPLGNRDDHPRCHTRVGTARCQNCGGCRCLANLEQTWAALDPQGSLVDLIGSSVARTAAMRPTIQNMRSHPLFSGVDFRDLLRSQI